MKFKLQMYNFHKKKHKEGGGGEREEGENGDWGISNCIFENKCFTSVCSCNYLFTVHVHVSI